MTVKDTTLSGRLRRLVAGAPPSTGPQGGYDPAASIARDLRRAWMLVGALILAGLLMASVIRVAGAVIAPGELVVASDIKRIQHPTGGVVAQINVHDGSRVRAGDVLISLDPTAMGANVTIVSDAVDELLAKQARLQAERDGRRSIVFPPDLMGRASQPGAAAVIKAEVQLFDLRTGARAGEKAQLRERASELGQQVKGFEEEMAAKQAEVKLIENELVGVRSLYDQHLVPLSRLNALERSAVQLRGDIGQLTASVAEAREKISEVALQSIQVDEVARTDAGGQLSETENQLAELQQKKVAAQQDFKRIQIRSPQDGIVDKLSAHTVGGVIAPAETIMLIVPDRDRLRVEARIRPRDIAKVHLGQEAMLRLSAFDQRTTPELAGRVSRISPDLTSDPRTGASYYVVETDIPDAQIRRLEGRRLTAGMPVEVFVQTHQRTIMSYLVGPLTDQLKRAFRD
ncbi:MAG TPA: HlyD family type I secretion periplasmic adaptor subunit [Caulobacteraceae bacterium]